MAQEPFIPTLPTKDLDELEAIAAARGWEAVISDIEDERESRQGVDRL